jgi:hypothetical protein
MRPLQYPDFADHYHLLRVFPTGVSDEQRFPAYSGATVPDSNRLPVADVAARLARYPQSPSASGMSRAEWAARPGCQPNSRPGNSPLKKGRVGFLTDPGFENSECPSVLSR